MAVRRACTCSHRGPDRCTENVLALLAYGYLIVGIRMARHCEQDGSFRRRISMEHLNYACRVEDFFFA